MFEKEGIPYFRVVSSDNETAARMEEVGVTGSSISTGFVDDVLLGPLEDVGLLVERNLISLDEAYEQFDSYVQLCIENKAVADYIRVCRSGQDDEDVWDHLQALYRSLELRGPEIRAKKKARS
jgi:hypothetical protein